MNVKTRWIYSKDSQPLFYRIDNNIYERGGNRAFWVSGTWWHSSEGGEQFQVHAGRRRAVRLMAVNGRQRRFDDPIPLPGDRFH